MQSIVRRFTDINIASRVREAIEADRLRFDAQLILPFGSSEHTRPHYELLLRMIDEDGKTVGPGSLSFRGQSLSADADDRSLGRAEGNHAPEAAREAICLRSPACSRSTSPASR